MQKKKKNINERQTLHVVCRRNATKEIIQCAISRVGVSTRRLWYITANSSVKRERLILNG